MSHVFEVVLHGLGAVLMWFIRSSVTIARVILEEIGKGIFAILRPILPWVTAVGVVYLAFIFRPEETGTALALLFLGLVFKAMFSSSKSQGRQQRGRQARGRR